MNWSKSVLAQWEKQSVVWWIQCLSSFPPAFHLQKSMCFAGLPSELRVYLGSVKWEGCVRWGPCLRKKHAHTAELGVPRHCYMGLNASVQLILSARGQKWHLVNNHLCVVYSPSLSPLSPPESWAWLFLCNESWWGEQDIRGSLSPGCLMSSQVPTNKCFWRRTSRLLSLLWLYSLFARVMLVFQEPLAGCFTLTVLGRVGAVPGPEPKPLHTGTMQAFYLVLEIHVQPLEATRVVFFLACNP